MDNNNSNNSYNQDDNQYMNQQCQTYQQSIQHQNNSCKSELVAFLLWWFLGVWGAHHFYVGKIGIGIIWILTGGCFGIGNLIDFIHFFNGTFTDKDGQTLNPDCHKALKLLAIGILIIPIVLVLIILFILMN